MALTTIFVEQQISGFGLNELTSTYYIYIAPPPFSLVVGETYKVLWDGTEYECVAQDVSAIVAGMVAIGNGAAFGLSGNNEPFIIGVAEADANFFVIDAEDTRESHVVGIYQGVEDETEVSPDDSTEETLEGIVLKDRNGNDVAYYGIETVTFDTTTEGKQQTYTKGVVAPTLEVPVTFADGDMPITADSNTLIKEIVLQKPDSLMSENIRSGVEIAGVVGDFIGDTEETTVELSMVEGNQIIEPSEIGKVLSKVLIQKPETLVPENIAEGIDIAGVIGTMVPGGGADAPKILVKTIPGTQVASGLSTLATAEELATIGFDDASYKFASLIAITSQSTTTVLTFNLVTSWIMGYKSGSNLNSIYGYVVRSGNYNNLTLANMYAKLNTNNETIYSNTVFGYNGELVYNLESTYKLSIASTRAYWLIVGCFS